MRRAMLDHPCRPILVHIPAISLDYIDGIAREAQTSRSEVIRQRLAPPTEVQPHVGALGSRAKKLGA
jgi:hypothetical protein